MGWWRLSAQVHAARRAGRPISLRYASFEFGKGRALRGVPAQPRPVRCSPVSVLRTTPETCGRRQAGPDLRPVNSSGGKTRLRSSEPQESEFDEKRDLIQDPRACLLHTLHGTINKKNQRQELCR
jgi:hypothetical protein